MAKSCHDYKFLVERWRVVARNADLRLRKIAVSDGLPVYALASPLRRDQSAIYISAGIHGDEPGATEGLLAWAVANAERLRKLPLLMFPCLNPWGLAQNRRHDSSGCDLNRMFHKPSQPVVAAVRNIAGSRKFQTALMLHEDYDGEGIYLYEHARGDAFSGRLLRAGEQFIRRDTRVKIDGRKAAGGVLSPRITAKLLQRIGLPEAVWLFLRGSENAVTFETPSEHAIELRAKAHSAVIDAFVSLSVAKLA